MAETNTELKGEDHSSRFQVLERPTVYPGQCACCGSVNRPVVDFGVEIDFEREGYGALLLCEFCCKQAASKFPEPETTNDAQVDYEHKLASDRAWISNELRNLADRYNLGVTLPVYGTPDSVSEQTEPADTQDTEPELQREQRTVSGLVEQTDESVSEQGSVSVPSDSSDGDSDPLGFLRGV